MAVKTWTSAVGSCWKHSYPAGDIYVRIPRGKKITYYNIIIIIIIYKIFKRTYDRQKPSTAAVIRRNRTRTHRGGSPSPPYSCWQWSSSATAALSQSRSTTCAVRSSLVRRVSCPIESVEFKPNIFCRAVLGITSIPKDDFYFLIVIQQ